MKHLGKLTFGVMALLLSACSSDEPIVNPDDASGNGTNDVYASLTLRLPSASSFGARTRAEGDEQTTTTPANNGIEFGQDYENNVGKILVILATKNADGQYTYLTKAESDAKPNSTDVPANTVKYVLNFSSEEMTQDPLDKPGDNGSENGGSYIPGSTPVYVFVYCNPTDKILTDMSGLTKGDTFTGKTGAIDGADATAIWEPNKFLMTNSEITEVTYTDDNDNVIHGLPSRADLVNKYNTPDKALNLGTVKVKRAVARFDFESTNENKYNILDIDGETVLGEVELTEMAMFNIAKNYYYLPRTNATWTWGGATTLCGDLEGFVMSYDNGFKKAETLSNVSGLSGYYFNHLINNHIPNLKWTSLKGWNEKKDNDGPWTPSDGTDYRIWRYSTENTIPGGAGGATSTQKIGITTGVVFKGEFNPVNKKRWNGNVVYMHNNIAYGDLDELKEYVEKYPETVVAADFEALKKEVGYSELGDLKKNILLAIATDKRHSFKAYEANADGKYEMYYFYYNRHNTNGNNSLMGSNEFGVVRNNVYKLKVTKIGSFGEPEFPNKPDDPNEEEHAYFTVTCLVMPWTVRVNDIEF